MSEFHVVLGAGQVGPLVAAALVEQGYRVRVIRKSTKPVDIKGVEVVSMDISDADEVARQTEGASSVYHCVNPPYSQWSQLLMKMTGGIVEGTLKSGADLIVLDNLYMYGDTSKMNAYTPVAPVSRKGKLRAEAAELMLSPAMKGNRRVVIGRAADFFGPGTTQSLLGDRFFHRVLGGKNGEAFGNPDMLHSYSYVPDVAAGLVKLGTTKGAEGIYMLPLQPAETTREVYQRFYRALGVERDISRIPGWFLRAMGLFNRDMGELVEMLYQWEQPFIVDDSRIRAEFGLVPTPWEEAVDRTIEWGRAVFG